MVTAPVVPALDLVQGLVERVLIRGDALDLEDVLHLRAVYRGGGRYFSKKNEEQAMEKNIAAANIWRSSSGR